MSGAVFWDLDGTLLSTGGIGWPCFSLQFNPNAEEIAVQDVSGLTDYEIAALLAKSHPSRVEKIVQTYLECLEVRLKRVQITKFLEAARALNSQRLAHLQHVIVTGNHPLGAKIKLASARLKNISDGVSIFGSSPSEWNRSLIAQVAAKQLGVSQVVFVGDTPNDVEAATQFGTGCIGLGTGHYSAQELSEAGASRVLEAGFTSDELAYEIAAEFELRFG